MLTHLGADRESGFGHAPSGGETERTHRIYRIAH